MKLLLLTPIFLILLVVNLYAEDNFIDVRLASESVESGYFIVYDQNIGKLYVADSSILLLTDIAKAEAIVDSEKPPLWLNSAVKSVGGKIQYPQIKILFTMNQAGKEKFAQVTSDNIGKRMAVFIDKKLIMAPKIMERIDSGRALVTTSFTEEEAQDLVNKINKNINKN
jgi:preprotein translocase subunit SecD